MAERRKYSFQVGAGCVHYDVVGQGEPLVLLHGLSGSARWWTKNVQELANHFQLYVINLLGFGSSRRQKFVLREAADMMKQWMHGVQIESAHMMGHSMGGYIAADLAANQPELVRKIVLVDALALGMRHNLIQHTWNLLRALRFIPIDFWPVLTNDFLQAGPATLFRAFQEIRLVDLSQDLRRIKSPALIVWGQHDTVLPLELGKKLHAKLPQARFEVIAGAGHNPMWDRAKMFNQLVIDFLR
jgi:pimeloyl-ACP methyl ester carboxylesterase